MTALLPIILSAFFLQPPAAPPIEAQPPAPDPTKVIINEAIIQPPPKMLPGAGDARFADSDALLAALETSGNQIRTLTANLTHINRKSELEAGQVLTKYGTIAFQNEPAPAPATAPSKPVGKLFQIAFNEIEYGKERHAEDQTFIFDGQWLVEKQFKNKQMFKYRVVPPGAAQLVDPLAIGEGPFPIPIGQKRDRILERFHATLMPSEDGFPQPLNADGKPFPIPAWVKETYQLRLIPKINARESRDYQQIRIWYRKSDLVPQAAKTIKLDDSSDEIMLSKLGINGPLPAGAFETTDLPGWDIQIEEFREAKADK